MCVECTNHTTRHPQTGLFTPGRWFSKAQLNRHLHQPQQEDAPWVPSHTSAKTWTGFIEHPSTPTPVTPNAAIPSNTSGPTTTQPANTTTAQNDADRQVVTQTEFSPADLGQIIDTCLRRLKSSSQPLTERLGPVRFHASLHSKGYLSLRRDVPPIDLLKLDPNASSNAPFIAHQRELARAEALLAHYSGVKQVQTRIQLSVLSDTIAHHRKKYEAILTEEWKLQLQARMESRFIDTGRYHQNTLRLLSPGILALYIMVTALYLLSNVSQKDCGFMLAVLKMTMANQADTSTSIHSRSSADSMLLNMDSVLQLLDIYPSTTTYVCCKACYCLYWIDPQDPSPNYPDRCTNQTGLGRCSARLWKTKKTPSGKRRVPVREYTYRDAADYISQMKSREDIAEWLSDDPAERPSDPDNAWDIWDAPALREFEFSDGKRFTSSTTESRLVFGLNFDGFNPGGNREAGKVVKVGAIYLVCLNLPPAIRHNIENIYLVGIVPGPDGPSTDEINHLLKPLIDDFIVLWRTGLYLSQTHHHPNGIRVRGAIVPLICDLPAARQMAGSANYMHSNFCSECKLKKSEMNNLDCDSWEPRTWEEHIDQAKKWRNAATADVRAQLVKEHGVRWSQLLRLPYWDPTRFTLIDSMHAFYLRIFQHHVRKIWGMDIELEDGEGITRDRSAKAPGESDLQKAHHIFRHGTLAQLHALPRTTLVELCRDMGSLPVRGKKEVLLNKMHLYRISQRWFTEDGNPISEERQAGADNAGTGATNAQVGGWEMAHDDGGSQMGGEKADTDNNNDEDDNNKDDDDDDDSENDGDEDEDEEDEEDEEDDEERSDSERSIGHGVDADDTDEMEEGVDRGGRPNSEDAMDEDTTTEPTGLVGKGDAMDVDSERPAIADDRNWALLRDGVTSTLDFLKFAPDYKVKTAVKADLLKVFYDHVAPRLGPTVVETASRSKNSNLVAYILEERERRGIDGTKPKIPKLKATRVLGRQTLKEIRSDMRGLNRPSWQANGPIKPGEKKRGKFTADQWRTFCTVNLPVTLIRLWGGAEEGSLERRRLDNFMYLVTAVKIATMNAMNEERIREYEYNMHQYLKTLLELYPATQITPYQHLSLHFGRHLRMFGPVHAWRCFPFERYNFLLQSISTNNKFSELEKTMFNKFTTAQRLRTIMADCKRLPDAIKPMVALFQKNYDTKFQVNVSGLFVDDERWGSGESTSWETGGLDSLPAGDYLQLQAWLRHHDPDCREVPPVARFHNSVHRYGRKLSTLSTHRNDSQVMFATDSDGRLAGTLQRLFSHRRQNANGEYISQVFVAITPYEDIKAEDEHHDHYRRYHPDAGGKLVYNTLADHTVVVPVTNIRSHVASQVQVVQGIQRECLMVQPLNRH